MSECAEELQARFLQTQEAMSRLNQGTDEVRAFVNNERLVRATFIES